MPCALPRGTRCLVHYPEIKMSQNESRYAQSMSDSMQFGDYQVRLIKAADTISIRNCVLRPHQTPAECEYEGDHGDGAIHLGGLTREGDLIAIATVLPQVEQRFSRFSGAVQHRLRGMAVLPEHRSGGLGRFLLEASLEKSKLAGCEVFWYNARVTAAEFYLKSGFETLEDKFELPGIGPHYVMFKNLSAE